MKKQLNKIITSIVILCLFFVTFLVSANENSKQLKLEAVTLQLKWKHQFQFAGYYAALAQGYYQQEGLAVSIKPLTLGIEVIDQVISGTTEYAIGGSGILVQYAKGKPIKALAAIFQHDALVFLSKQSSGIISPYEMAGKRIMFDGLTGDNAPLHALLSEANLTPDKYILGKRELGNQSFIDGNVDVMSAYLTDQTFSLKQQGIKLNIINPQNYGFDFYGDILYTSQTELDNYPGRAQRFRRASLKGWSYALEHTEELIQLIKNQYNSESSFDALRYEAEQMRKLILAAVIPIGNIEVSRLRRVADLYSELKMTKQLSDAELKGFLLDTQKIDQIQLSANERAWIKAHPVIRVGVDRDFAPYEWVDKDGNYQGLAADYMRLLEKSLGVRFEIIYNKPWHEIQQMAKDGELDMLSCVNSTPIRAEFLNFTQSYVTNPIVIINTNRHGYVGSLERLSGKTIAVEENYFTHEKLLNQYPQINLLVVGSTNEALTKVATGEADAYLGDAAFANYAIKKGNLLNLQFAGQIEDNSAYKVGINKTHPELLSIISKVFNHLNQQEKDVISERWMGLTVNEGVDIQTIIYGVIGVSTFFVLFLYRYFSLHQSKQKLDKSVTRLQAILDASPIPYALNDKNNIVYLNKAFVDTFGYGLADIPTLADWWPKAYPEEGYREWVLSTWKQRLDNIKNNLQQFEPIEVNICCQNGDVRHVSIGMAMTDVSVGDIQVVIFFDMTERKRAEETMQLYGRVFSEAHEGILITGVNGLIEDVNPAFCNITGYSHHEVVGQNPRMLSSGKHLKVFYQQMWKQLSDDGYWHGEIWNRKKSGELYAELLTISSLKNHQGEIKHYVGLFSDITESKQQQSVLEKMAHYDVLTQLPNRTLFSDRFTQAISHSKRTQTLLAICFIDLDDFKPVNDTYGHDIGDKLLIEVAQRIKINIREEDTISRQGGDEFALLLGDLKSVEQCEQMVERLHESLAKPYLIDGHALNISASSGITLFPNDDGDIDTLMRHADQAMYKSKLSGKNRYYLFDAQDDQQLVEKHHQLDEIQQALLKGELQLFYQPKVNMKTGLIFGAEALIRWLHPDKGLIPPLDFLPVLEGTELEVQLGEWVITQALKQLDQWKNMGIDIEVSVNISSYHLHSPLFFSQLETALEKYPNVYSKKLELEILESSALGDINTIGNVIKICQEALGVKVALDDFGTGYSSLAHLRNLSAEMIKIDQSFIRDILDDPSDYVIVDGVIGLADSFSRNVIAEGVETTEQGLMLLLMGCSLAQGYGISKPMPAAEMPEWLEHYSANEAWLVFAHKQHTLKEKKIKVLSLATDHWVARFESRLMASAEENMNWPIMSHKLCHHGAWFLREKKDQLFDSVWLDELEQVHEQVHDIANQLIQQYQMGKLQLAREGFPAFQVAHDKMIVILKQYG